MESTCIAIPAKDEESGLTMLLEELNKSKMMLHNNLNYIFVVDDRSTDRTRELSNDFGGVVIDQSKLHGKGLAIRSAISQWSKHPTDYFIMMDADGSYRWDDVYRVIGELQAGANAVVGIRLRGLFSKVEGMSLVHHIGNHTLALAASLRTKKRIRDLCSGLWGFDRQSLQKISLTATGFDLEAELHSEIRKKKINLCQIQIDWRARVGGESKLKSFIDGFRILWRIIKN